MTTESGSKVREFQSEGSLGELPASSLKEWALPPGSGPILSPWPWPMQSGFCCCHLPETSLSGVKMIATCQVLNLSELFGDVMS